MCIRLSGRRLRHELPHSNAASTVPKTSSMIRRRRAGPCFRTSNLEHELRVPLPEMAFELNLSRALTRIGPYTLNPL